MALDENLGREDGGHASLVVRVTRLGNLAADKEGILGIFSISVRFVLDRRLLRFGNGPRSPPFLSLIDALELQPRSNCRCCRNAQGWSGPNSVKRKDHRPSGDRLESIEVRLRERNVDLGLFLYL